MPGTFVDGIDSVAIDPAPPLGASIVATFACSASFGGGVCDDPEAKIDTPFVIGPADSTAPAAPAEVVLLQQDGDFNVGCDEETVDLRLDAIVELDVVEPGTWVEVELSRNGEVIGRRALLADTEGELTSVHYLERDQLEGTEVCAAAIVRDASGNVSAAARTCEGFAGTGRGCACAATPRAATIDWAPRRWWSRRCSAAGGVADSAVTVCVRKGRSRPRKAQFGGVAGLVRRQ